MGVAPTKNISRFEWFIEKATEIGIDTNWETMNSSSSGTSFTWLRGPNALLWEFAVGATSPQQRITFFRAVFKPQFVSAEFLPEQILVNTGVASETTDLTVVVTGADEVIADLSAIGGNSENMTSLNDSTWSLTQISSVSDSGIYQIPITASNVAGDTVFYAQLELVEDNGSEWTNQTDEVSFDEDILGSFTVESDGEVVFDSYPNFLTVNDNEISGTADNSHVGSYTIVFHTVSSLGVVLNYSLNWVVTNVAPVFITSPPTQGMTEVLYSYTPEVDEGNISIIEIPSFLSWNGTTVSGTPTIGDVGLHTCILQVDDGNNGIITQEWELEVVDGNVVPTIVLPDFFQFDPTVGLIVDFDEFVDDQNGDELTLTVEGNTDIEVSIDGLVVTFSVTGDFFGTENITFNVDDGNGGSASDDVVVIADSDPSSENIFDEDIDFVVTLEDSIFSLEISVDNWAIEYFDFDVLEFSSGENTTIMDLYLDESENQIVVSAFVDEGFPIFQMELLNDGNSFIISENIQLLPEASTLHFATDYNLIEPLSIGYTIDLRYFCGAESEIIVMNEGEQVFELSISEIGLIQEEIEILESWIIRETQDLEMIIENLETSETISFDFQITFTDVEEDLQEIQTCLQGNYPNPFNPITSISFSISKSNFVSINIYNLKGQFVTSLVNENLERGHHSVTWDGKDNSEKLVSSGIYLYKLNVNGKTESMKKCLLLK
jgi:hypothetical protein